MDPRYKIGMRNIKTAIAVGVCLIFFQILGISDGIIASITAVICMKSSIQNSLLTGMQRVTGTFIGALLAVVTLILIEDTPYHISTLVVLIGVVLIIYLCNVFKIQASTIISVVVFLIILVGEKDAPPLIYGIMRLVETIFGIAVTYLINRFIDPRIFLKKTNVESYTQISKSDDEDIALLMAIWLNSNISSHPSIDELYWHRLYDSVRKSYLDNSEIFIFEEDEKLLGFISILEYSKIEGIYVLDKERKRTIEKQLLNYCQQYYNTLSVNVFAENKDALDFYINENFYQTEEIYNEELNTVEYNLQWSVKS